MTMDPIEIALARMVERARVAMRWRDVTVALRASRARFRTEIWMRIHRVQP